MKSFIGDFDPFPILTFVEFFFYMGWLKVAETMFNPFGEDDDDFEMNVFIDQYMKEALVIVDKMYFEVPDLMKDAYWDQKQIHLPVTEATAAYKKVNFAGSAAEVQVPEKGMEQIIEEESVTGDIGWKDAEMSFRSSISSSTYSHDDGRISRYAYARRSPGDVRSSVVDTPATTAGPQSAAHISASSWIATAEAGLDPRAPSPAPPHPLQDVVDREIHQLRQADMSAPHYDPEWD